ncbi:hypothetical protein JJC03_02530 [Flavobacterium oreochromis]|uniref:hypothetical protein n=1 Tax=Flavobacterium oreochromis TaxID=2906078 RepID=UPI001CE56B9D|nr:hypothetical protein [Flavobacterium oreochromis]QYS86901.1 hypothetical protein JJC03_02530 [Flavobacterium oreochromis]
MYKHPFYLAEIQIRNCQVQLLINDVPCFDSYKEGGTAVDWPINEYILSSGKQFYTIHANCFENESAISKYASIDFKITVRDAFDFSIPKQTIKQHFKISFEEKETQMYSTGSFFEVEIPYTLEGWSNSFSFSDYVNGNNAIKQRLFKELKEYYELFYQIIKERDIDKYNLLNAERFEEITTAFYLTKEEKESRKKTILNSSRQDVHKIDFSNYLLKFYGNKEQIVGIKIKDQPCGFVFENEEGMIITELALFHQKDNESKLSLIR